MATVATLTIDLVAKSAKLRSELGKTNKYTKSWASKTRAQVNTVGKAMSGVAAGGIAAMAIAFAKTSGDIDKLAKTASKLGVLPEKLRELQYSGELTGVSVNTLDMGLQRMTRRVAEAAHGTGEAVKALKELGLSAKDLNDLSPDEQMSRIADAMQNVAGQSDKVRLSMKLFDSEGVALVNTLAGGSEGLKAMAEEAQMLGITLNNVQTAGVEAANDAITKSNLAMSGYTTQLTAHLAPAVEAYANQLTGVVIGTEGVGEASEIMAENIINSLGVAADVANGLKVTYLGILALMGEIANKNTQLTLEALKTARAAELVVRGVDPNQETYISKQLSDLIAVRAEFAAYTTDFKTAAMASAPSEVIKEGIEANKKAREEDAQAIAAGAEREIENLKKVATERKILAGLRKASGVSSDTPEAGTDASAKAFQVLKDSFKSEKDLIMQQHSNRRQIIIDNTIEGGEARKALLLQQSVDTNAALSDAEDRAQKEKENTAFERVKKYLTSEREQLIEGFRNKRETILNNTLQTEEEKQAMLLDLKIRQNLELQELDQKKYEEDNEAAIKAADEWVAIWDNASERFSAGVGDAVAGAIFEQESFSEAAKAMVIGIGKQVVSSLVQIGVQKLIQASLSKATLATETTAAVAAGTAIALAWAPAAAATSLASFGGNSGPAMAGITATNALSTTLAGVMHDGGAVPTDGTYFLQKGEFVQSKDNVDKGSSEKLSVVINNAPAGNHSVSQDERGITIDLAVDKMIDEMNGGRVGDAMESRYGINSAYGARR